MAKGERVNVWYDRPGDFLEIGWSWGTAAFNGYTTSEDDIVIHCHLTEDFQAVGFYILGALYSPCRRPGKSKVVAQVQPHPVTVAYNPAQDLWQIQWGPAIVDCLDTPNSRIRAQVDAAGHIQGLEIRDLRTFDAEILNQDLRPAELGIKTG